MSTLHDIVVKGSTDRSVTVRIIDSADGTPETGVVFNTAGIDLWYRREGAAVTSITEVTLAALTTAHADGGFLHVGNGVYRLDLPDAAFATAAQYVDFGGTVTGMIVIGGRVRLIDSNIETANMPADLRQVMGAADGASGLENAGTHYDNFGHFNSDQNVLSSAITTVTSQTIFILTSGIATDDIYNDMMVVVYGIDSLAERHLARVVDYVGSTKTLTIDVAAPWTVNTFDEINILAIPKQVKALPTATAGAAGGVFIAGTNAATTITTGLTANITGNLVGTVSTLTTYTGNTPQTGDNFARIGAAGAGLTALATQISVNDLPTNAELATAMAAADDAVLAAIAALNNLSSAGAATAATTALTTALTEGYRGTNATGSVRDLLYEVIAHLGKSAIASTTKTLKKLDGSTAKTYTLDSATVPTSITETT